MTSIDHVARKCANCGREDTYVEIMSTNSFGSPDLDLRPPEMKRSTIDFWVQCCGECGYCSHDVSARPDASFDIINSEAYRQQLENQQYPPLANHLLCYSMIQEHGSDYFGAGLSSMHAAWSCDDAGMNSVAVECRRRAITLLKRARFQDQFEEENDPPGAANALLVDLMRRSEQFDLAMKACEEGLARQPDPVIAGVLSFQMARIQARDVSAYTVDDALQSSQD